MGLHLGSSGELSVEELAQVAAIPEFGLFTVLSHYPLGTVLSMLGSCISLLRALREEKLDDK